MAHSSQQARTSSLQQTMPHTSTSTSTSTSTTTTNVSGSQGFNLFAELPLEITALILSYLRVSDVGHFARTCCVATNIMRNASVWIAIYYAHSDIALKANQSGKTYMIRMFKRLDSIESTNHYERLAVACSLGWHTKVAEILCQIPDGEFDINQSVPRTYYSTKPPLLFVAVRSASVQCVKVLLDHQALVTVDRNNQTPLDVAFLGANAELIELLLERYEQQKQQHTVANVSIANLNLQQLLDSAVMSGRTSFVQLLLRLNASLDSPNHHYLHTAAASGSIAMVQKLVDLKCDPYAVNRRRKSLLYHAVSTKKLAISMCHHPKHHPKHGMAWHGTARHGMM
jgi:ankyrin repeat protein